MEVPMLSGFDGSAVAVIGALLIVIGWVIFLVLRGHLVTRAQLDDAKATTEVFRQAWEVSQENQQVLTEGLETLSGLTDTFAHFIESLPEAPRGE